MKKLLGAYILICFLLFSASSALAMVPQSGGGWRLSPIDPAVTLDHPTDGLLILSGYFDWYNIGTTPTTEEALQYFSFKVLDEEGLEISGALSVNELQRLVVWQSDESLTPQHTYSVEIKVDNAGLSSDNYDREVYPDISTSFEIRTGDGLAGEIAPPEISAFLEYEAYDSELCDPIWTLQLTFSEPTQRPANLYKIYTIEAGSVAGACMSWDWELGLQVECSLFNDVRENYCATVRVESAFNGSVSETEVCIAASEGVPALGPNDAPRFCPIGVDQPVGADNGVDGDSGDEDAGCSIASMRAKTGSGHEGLWALLFIGFVWAHRRTKGVSQA